MTDFPQEGMGLTHILVCRDTEASKDWYLNVLGATLYRQYGRSVVLTFNGVGLLLVPESPPTEDKPSVHMVPPEDPDRPTHSFTIRVPDCEAAYAILKDRGAEFLTPPFKRGIETRCFFRDPDGHLYEISAVK